MADSSSPTTTPTPRRTRSRGFSLSLSINSPRRPLSLVSSNNTLSPVTPGSNPPTPGRFKRVLKRLSSFRIFHPRSPSTSSASYQWNAGGMLDTDYMYDDDIDVSYEGLLSLAARIGDAKPRNLPSELKDTLPRGVYKDTPQAQVEQHCAICLEKYENEHDVMGVTECAHFFHAQCFETWLDLASNCPVCRRDLTPEDYQRPNTTSTITTPSQQNAFEYGGGDMAVFVAGGSGNHLDVRDAANSLIRAAQNNTYSPSPMPMPMPPSSLRIVTLDEMRSHPEFRRFILPPPPVPEDY